MKLMHNQNVPNPRIEAPGDWPDPKFPLCWETPLRYKHEIRRSILRKLIAQLHNRNLGMTKYC